MHPLSNDKKNNEEPVDSTPEARWSGKARGGRFGHLFFIFLVRHRLLAVAYFFLFWVALYFLVAAPQARRASFDLARRLGMGKSLLGRIWFAYRHFFTFGSLLLDRVAILGGSEDLYEFEFHGEENIHGLLKGGEGAVILTAHLGNWESLGQFLGRYDVPLTVVMHDGAQPELRKTMEELSRGKAFRILFTDGTPATAARVLSALSRGELVGMMGDRVLADGGIEVPFLNGTAAFPAGPFALSAAAGVPLVYAFAVRKGLRRYAFHAPAPVRLVYSTPGEKRVDLERWCRQWAQHLEVVVRKYPAQWRNLFGFWTENRGAREE